MEIKKKYKTCVSHLIPNETVDSLEDLFIAVRGLIGNRNIRKSLIIERLIELGLKDWKTNGRKSALYTDLTTMKVDI